MTDSYRTGLRDVVIGNQRVENPGLILDRYQQKAVGGRDKTALPSLLERVRASPLTDIYRDAYDQWKATILALPGVRARELKATSRLIVGLGAESVRETGITLMKPYGVPYLPGSALKGLARKYTEAVVAARQAGHALMPRHADPKTDDERAQNAANQHHVFFGDQQSAAYVTYFDAWYIPGSLEGDQPLLRDVITVHHPNYYNKSTRQPPWDLDDPIPIPYLCATGSYLVAVQGPDAERGWAENALNLIECALADWGIGGKTSSGYGRMTPVGDLLPLSVEEREAQAGAEALIAQIQALTAAATVENVDGKPRIRALYEEARLLEDEALKTRAYRAIRDKLSEAGVLPQWQSGQRWVQGLMAYLQTHA